MSLTCTILGCGCSTSVPSLSCLLQGKRDGDGSPCEVCLDATANPNSKNRRGNPSLLIQFKKSELHKFGGKVDPPKTNGNKHDGDDDTEDQACKKAKSAVDGHDDDDDSVNVMIDCGKTFRQSVIRLFPKLGVKTLQGVILTHDHADALFGVDDLRSVQKMISYVDEYGERQNIASGPINMYLSDETYERVRQTFHYLVPAEDKFRAPDEKVVKQPQRFVSTLDWHIVSKVKETRVSEMDPMFYACGLPVQPVRLLHGGDYIALGFIFGPEEGKCAYLSDVKTIPPLVWDYLKTLNIEVLLIDCLYMKDNHSTHMSISETVEVVRKLRPKRSIFVGMTHDFNYYKFEEIKAKYFAEEGDEELNVDMGFDGLTFTIGEKA